MRAENTCALPQGGWPAVHGESEGQHGPGEVDDGDFDDDEGGFPAAVGEGVGIGEGEDQRLGEDV